MNKKMERMEVLEDLEQRIKDMVASDKLSGEHKDASVLDYIGWAIEEIELNSED